MSTKPFDGDSEGTRAAFREYDDRNSASGRSAWQIWRDACAYAFAAEAATCKLCQSTGPDVPCAYPTEINRQQAQRIAELEAMLAGCPTADETLKPVAHVPIHPRTGPLWANTVPDLDSGDRPKHYPTRALYFAEDATEASRSADDESAKSGVDTTAIMERIPTVARLYYTGLTTRRYRRASVHTGPGEPLVYRSDVERELRHIDWELRNPPEPAPVASKETVTLSDAARDVLAERQRQVSDEGWTPEHDDEHDDCEMALAAIVYAESAVGYHLACPDTWPWSPKWFKPTTPRRDLVKAGALILAEIERIDRAAQRDASKAEQKS